MTLTAERFTPTVSQHLAKYRADLQLVALQTLSEAAGTNRPADYISSALDVIRDSYGPREVTYLVQFLLHHAERRGLLGAEGTGVSLPPGARAASIMQPTRFDAPLGLGTGSVS